MRGFFQLGGDFRSDHSERQRCEGSGVRIAICASTQRARGSRSPASEALGDANSKHKGKHNHSNLCQPFFVVPDAGVARFRHAVAAPLCLQANRVVRSPANPRGRCRCPSNMDILHQRQPHIAARGFFLNKVSGVKKRSRSRTADAVIFFSTYII